MTSTPLILSLVRRSELYRDSFRKLLGGAARIVFRSDSVPLDLGPWVVILDFESPLPTPLLSGGEAGRAGWETADDSLALPQPANWAEALVAPNVLEQLPWNWQHWPQRWGSQLIALVPQLERFQVHGPWTFLPQNVTPRELALAARLGLELAHQRRRQQLGRHQHARLTRLAYRDPLTGLANRRAWRWQLRRLNGSLDADPGSGVTDACYWVVLVDLDDFKQVNSDHGHVVADRVLRQVGQVLSGSLRSCDVAARLGGDEFGLLVGPLEREHLERLLDRIREQLAEALPEAGLPSVTATMAAAPLRRSQSARQVLYRVAESLRQLKQRRGGAVRWETAG